MSYPKTKLKAANHSHQFFVSMDTFINYIMESVEPISTHMNTNRRLTLMISININIYFQIPLYFVHY